MMEKSGGEMSGTQYMYVGCFTAIDRGGSGTGGIVVYKREKSKPWKQIQIVENFNPSYLSLSEDKRFLYGIQGKGSRVFSYAISEQSGMLSSLNSVETTAGLACEAYGGYLYIVAGTVQIYKLEDDGSIGEKMQDFMPTGIVGPISKTQKCAQPHHILHDAQNRFFAVPCRGMDVVHVYDYNPKSNAVEDICAMQTYGASYPRHIAFHPELPIAYLLLERYGMVLTCHYEDGVLTPVEMLPTVPSDFVGLYNAAGEIFVHPSKRWLGISNRGHNSIVLFHIREDGSLCDPQWTRGPISVPRFYSFSQDGTELYCANIGETPTDRPLMGEAEAIPGTGSITVFRVDTQTGTLQFTGEKIDIPAPSCILFR